MEQYRPHNSLNQLTTVEFIGRGFMKDSLNSPLAGTPSSNPMIFAAAEKSQAVSEKSSDQLKDRKLFNAPKF